MLFPVVTFRELRCHATGRCNVRTLLGEDTHTSEEALGEVAREGNARKQAASSATPLGLRRQHGPFLLVVFEDTLTYSECKQVFQSAGGEDNAPLM